MKLAVQLGEEDRRAIAAEVVKLLSPLMSRATERSEEDRFFDVPGLANYLNLSTDWVYKQVQKQSIPFVKTERLVRFRKSAVDRWLAERTVNPQPKNPAKRHLKTLKARDS